MPKYEPDPFNLRLSRQTLRCLSGTSIPPGLVGCCWETPVGEELLAQQSPDLAHVLGTLDGLYHHHEAPEELQRLALGWVDFLDTLLAAPTFPTALPLPWSLGSSQQQPIGSGRPDPRGPGPSRAGGRRPGGNRPGGSRLGKSPCGQEEEP